MSAAREAAMRAADELVGTANIMPEIYEKYADDPLFCAVFDEQIFCCETCGWWCEISEMGDVDQVCEECGE